MGDVNPLSQMQVEREIMRLSSRLSTITTTVAEVAEREAKAEVAYKRAHAFQWLELRGHDGTVPEKEAMAFAACAAEYEEMKISEALHKASMEAGRNVRAQLDALRSIAANVRAAVDYASGRGG